MKERCPVCRSYAIAHSYNFGDCGWCTNCGVLLMLEYIGEPEFKCEGPQQKNEPKE